MTKILKALKFIIPASVLMAGFQNFTPLSTTSLDNEVVLFDLVNTLAPTTTEKSIPVFSDSNFTQACMITYRLDSTGKLQFSKQLLTSDQMDLRKLFKSSAAYITTWLGGMPLCSPDMLVAVDENNNLVLGSGVGPLGTRAHLIKIGSDNVTMMEKSTEVMANIFGGKPAFRSIGGAEAHELNLKLNQYLSVRFPEFKIADYSSLKFSLNLTPELLNVNTGCINSVPTQNSQYSQPCYDERIHASQFRLALGNVVWKDPRCTRKNELHPICKYYGDFLYTTMQLHDARREFFDDNSFHKDPGTSSWIYHVNMRRFLPGYPDNKDITNPLKILNNTTVISGDLLALLKEAILEASSHTDPMYLPPRLQNPDGSLESDEQYLAHFSLSTSNLGYEVTGLSGIKYKINQFKFSGTHK